MLLIIIWYFFDNYFWPQPPEIGLGLEVFASLASLVRTTSCCFFYFVICCICVVFVMIFSY